MGATREYLQQDQPEGVPPLALTGERTLPDVPEENYWYRRHLAVYEWVAARCAGLDVVDMAYGGPTVGFARDLVDSYSEPCDAVTFLQTIEHVEDDAGVLRHFKSMLRPGGTVYVSTPNLLTLAPPGAEKSDNPWHLREYRPEQFRALCESVFDEVELLGLFHARKLRVHELALKLGWDSVHKRLGLTGRFYDRFTPAIAASDFALRDGPLDSALDLVAVLR